MTAVHIWFQARIRQAFAGGSKRKWQIQVECVTCLKRVICLSPFFEILLLSNANWIVSSDHRSINMSVASLLQRQILPRFLDAMSFFPRKVQDFGALKAYFRPQSLRLRGQSWGQRLWERKFLQFRHADLVSGGPRLSPEVVSARLNFSERGPKNLLLHSKNQAGRALYYWPACENLGVPHPKWMSCKCVFKCTRFNWGVNSRNKKCGQNLSVFATIFSYYCQRLCML